MSRSYYMQHMLLQYGRQLTTARRLARHRQAMRLAGADDPPALPAETRRRIMVERVTGEIVENLLLSGSDSPIVLEVQRRLNEELGENFIFRYPPGELDICIFRPMSGGEPKEVLGEEKAHIMERLWSVAREIVDATML